LHSGNVTVVTSPRLPPGVLFAGSLKSHQVYDIARHQENNMSTVMVETATIATPEVAAPPVVAEPASASSMIKVIPVAAELEEVTFFDNHPLAPVSVIGAISTAMALIAVGCIVFWLAIRYSGVLAP
jgi:hypothetical protein